MGIFDSFKKQPNVNFNISMSTPASFEEQRNIEAKNNHLLDESCYRSKNGLKVSEVLLLEYTKRGNYPNPQGGYQNFWWFDYGINNVGQVLNLLKQRGFIRFRTPFEMLETLKVTQLKEILSGLDLPTKGKKEELIERIIQANDVSVLNGYIKALKYTLTELGEKELLENAYVPYMHSHKNIGLTVWEMNKLIHQQKRPFRDIIWGYFNQQIQNFKLPAETGLYRNHRLTMGDFVFEEKRYHEALREYILVCYYDVVYYHSFSGFDSIGDLLSPGILERIKKCKDHINIDNNSLYLLIQKYYTHENTYGRTIQISTADLARIIVTKIYNDYEQ